MDYVDTIKRALTLSEFNAIAAQRKMGMAGRTVVRPPTTNGEPRIGAVLLLLYMQQQTPHILFTQRPESLRDHSGQISFPGGKVHRGESLLQGALRETWEEVGVRADEIEVVGRLTQLYIPPTDFEVHPFVGFSARRPQFVPNRLEVAAIIEAPLPLLLDPQTRRIERRVFERYGNTELEVPFFDVDGNKIWGATAIMLSEFLERWRNVVRAIGEESQESR